MPTIHHQRISAFLFETLDAWVAARQLGEVLYAPLRVRVRKGKYREPDLALHEVRAYHAHQATILGAPRPRDRDRQREEPPP